jgi:hypothetical protein
VVRCRQTASASDKLRQCLRRCPFAQAIDGACPKESPEASACVPGEFSAAAGVILLVPLVIIVLGILVVASLAGQAGNDH